MDKRDKCFEHKGYHIIVKTHKTGLRQISYTTDVDEGHVTALVVDQEDNTKIYLKHKENWVDHARHARFNALKRAVGYIDHHEHDMSELEFSFWRWITLQKPVRRPRTGVCCRTEYNRALLKQFEAMEVMCNE